MAGPATPQQAALIASMARARGLDPAAVLSIASVEGGFNGSVGDNGTSFGPFQLHMGGALPAQFNGNAQAANAFANSPEGITYAENDIQKVAGGLRGKAAIQAISSQFERPADVAGEVAKASSRYGAFGSGAPLPSTNFSPASSAQSAPAPVAHSGVAAALSLLSQGQQGQANPVLQLAIQRQQAMAAQTQFGPTPSAATSLAPTGSFPIGAGSAVGQTIVKTAATQLGQPYQYGGTAKLGGHTDCSGLVQAVFGANGISLPRTSYEQWKVGAPVNKGQLQAGDEVFFNMTSSGPEHVGIYVGNDKFIEDPHTGASVTTKTLSTYPGFVGARRHA